MDEEKTTLPNLMYLYYGLPVGKLKLYFMTEQNRVAIFAKQVNESKRQ